MEVIYFLIPIAIILTAIIVGVFFWAIKSGQFDDLEGPAHRILMEDDDKPDTQNQQQTDDKPGMRDH